MAFIRYQLFILECGRVFVSEQFAMYSSHLNPFRQAMSLAVTSCEVVGLPPQGSKLDKNSRSQLAPRYFF